MLLLVEFSHLFIVQEIAFANTNLFLWVLHWLKVIYNRETDQSRGFGFVTMSTVEEAETAVEKFNRYVSSHMCINHISTISMYWWRGSYFDFGS